MKKDPYNAGPCPVCSLFAHGTWRHPGAPVICRNGHMWFPNTQQIAVDPRRTLENANEPAIPAIDPSKDKEEKVRDRDTSKKALNHIKNYLESTRKDLTVNLYDAGKMKVIQDLTEIIELCESI